MKSSHPTQFIVLGQGLERVLIFFFFCVAALWIEIFLPILLRPTRQQGSWPFHPPGQCDNTIITGCIISNWLIMSGCWNVCMYNLERWLLVLIVWNWGLNTRYCKYALYYNSSKKIILILMLLSLKKRISLRYQRKNDGELKNNAVPQSWGFISHKRMDNDSLNNNMETTLDLHIKIQIKNV